MNSHQIQQLQQQALFPDQPASVELISTHISWVLLSPYFAYKIKKPVQYSFLDFSTLEKRKYFCEEEVRLNQRLTTDMYLDVLPVVEHNGRIQVVRTAHAPIIDYAVRMKRMDSSRQMDILLKKREVTARHMKALARQLAPFHQKAEGLRGVVDGADLKEKFNDLNVISDWLIEQDAKEIAVTIRLSMDFSNGFIDGYLGHMLKRELAGMVIDGHGDLHAKNIFLPEDSPVIFDCIEFSPAFRQMDVLNELAFFCMDLDVFGRPDLRDTFMAHYLSLHPVIRSEEDERLFSYFKLYRANVRLKVSGLRAMQADDAESRKKWMHEIRQYHLLLKHYLKDFRYTPKSPTAS